MFTAGCQVARHAASHVTLTLRCLEGISVGNVAHLYTPRARPRRMSSAMLGKMWMMRKVRDAALPLLQHSD